MILRSKSGSVDGDQPLFSDDPTESTNEVSQRAPGLVAYSKAVCKEEKKAFAQVRRGKE